MMEIQDDKIYVVYGDKYFNINKMNLFLVFFNDIFECLSFNKKKLIGVNDTVLTKLVNVDKNQLVILNADFSNNQTIKNFQLGQEDLSKYIDPNKELCLPIIELEGQTNTEIANNYDEDDDEVNTNECQNNIEDSEKEVDDKYFVSKPNDIFCTKTNPNDINDCMANDLLLLNSKTKLTDIQRIAEKYSINVHKLNKAKKQIKKKKDELIVELVALLKTN